MRYLVLFIFIILFSNDLKSETDSTKKDSFFESFWNQLLRDSSTTAEDNFIAYPSVGYTPETSWELGFGSLYIYYANKDTTNRLSEIYGFTFYTLESQYGLWFDHALYSDQDEWFFLGRLRFQNFPLTYNGIGPYTQEEVIGTIEGRQITIRERVLRKVKDNFFIGLGLDFQDIHNPIFEPDNGYTNDYKDSIVGIDGSSNFGLGIGFVYDTRHNVMNVRDGFFSELSFLNYSNALGSDFDFTFINSDVRYFTPVNNNNVLATQFLGQFNMGNVPFNQMSLMGGESMMRGYYLGRYRDKNQIAIQAEFRMLPIELGFTDRLGLTFFGSAGTVFPNIRELRADNFVFAGGTGLRFLIFPQKDIYLRFDAAFTREGPGFYLWMGEAF